MVAPALSRSFTISDLPAEAAAISIVLPACVWRQSIFKRLKLLCRSRNELQTHNWQTQWHTQHCLQRFWHLDRRVSCWAGSSRRPPRHFAPPLTALTSHSVVTKRRRGSSLRAFQLDWQEYNDVSYLVSEVCVGVGVQEHPHNLDVSILDRQNQRRVSILNETMSISWRRRTLSHISHM